jgi:hypothetical protein
MNLTADAIRLNMRRVLRDHRMNGLAVVWADHSQLCLTSHEVRVMGCLHAFAYLLC